MWLAARAGVTGLLLDTVNKRGPGLRGLMAPRPLAAWVAEAHEAGLLVALAGRLTGDDLAFVRDAGADIAGVRGAACEGGRAGRIVAHKVRVLRDTWGHEALPVGSASAPRAKDAGSPGVDLPA
jgi:uncharacterized protein (UPF0264 family)